MVSTTELGIDEKELGIKANSEKPSEYTKQLKENSPKTTAFSDVITVANENWEPINFPKPVTVGETFVQQEIWDETTEWEDRPNSPVNRTLNITSLGKKLGKGATNIGYEVLEVDGLPENENVEYPLVVKAMYSFKTDRRATDVVYMLRQADLVNELAEANVGPRQYGVVTQEIPTTPTKDPTKILRYTVPVMEKVGEHDLGDIYSTLPEEEQEQVEEVVLAMYQKAAEIGDRLGYDIGDHGVRVAKTEGGYQAWIIDVGWLEKDQSPGFYPEDKIERLRKSR